MEFKHTQLDNGLTIIAEIMASARSTAVGFFTRTGSRDEQVEESGVSHFLEHMMFKGTEKRSALEVNLEFDQMGAKYNAFTSEENTVYYAVVLPEYQERILDLWADLLRPALRDSDFTTEKGVILEEIAMYKDMPNFDVMDRCRHLHFGDHCCGNSVLGTVESITALTSDQMRDYFNRRYAPDNMVLACAGNVNWDELVGQARALCSNWESSNPKRELSDFGGTGQFEAIEKENVVRNHLCMMTAAPSNQDAMRYGAGVLASIIGDVTNSRLYWALVDNAIADCADFDYDPMDGTGAYYTYASCNPEDSEKVVQIVKDCLAKVRRDGVTEKELSASINKIASSMTLSGEIPMGRLVPLGSNWIYCHEYKTLAEELEIIRGIGHDQLGELMERYPMDKLTVMRLGP
ncbi:MAG: insulinase family protein, partial [Phycisphaerae bacterium]|nr:insulinase family protein [Phycisphaerae bacterium]